MDVRHAILRLPVHLHRRPDRVQSARCKRIRDLRTEIVVQLGPILDRVIQRRGAHAALGVSPARAPLVGPLGIVHQGLDRIHAVGPLRRLVSHEQIVRGQEYRIVGKLAEQIGQSVAVAQDHVEREPTDPHGTPRRTLSSDGASNPVLARGTFN